MALTNTSTKDCCLQATKDIINLKNKLNITTFEMRSTDQTLHNTIMHINTSLTDQISNVSKQEGPSGPPGSQGPPGPQGPQGPPGIQGPVASGGANLSLCQFKIATSTPVTANSLAETDLIWMEPSGKRIVGATCSTNAALEYNFNSYTKPSGERVYRCMCKGQSSKFFSSTGKMYCYLNYWECPLN
ncbi:uncharacterized protein LOC116306295 [Actinia tenebrosa]|uniref:Uncharacterized protein LOC116306295 n=1 Tax=Actinia tenebrosa TaxID=6105 RepID=A0A6P8IYD6_ACTTE|nr:uncharacterized protein LOC116306295 [Actinia tenebrosa]